MKTLGKLKLWSVAACIVLGMSSCLKHDNSINVVLQYPYLLQTSEGTYIPQMRIQAGDPLSAAKVTVAGKAYSFTKINDYVFEIASSGYLTELDTVPAGICELTAVGVNEKTADLTFALSATTKKLGTVVAALTYKESESKIEIELADTVTNATSYYLVLQQPTGSALYPYSMWVPYADLTLGGENNLSATVTGINKTTFQAGTYRFAVGASRGSALRVGNYIPVTIEE